MSGARWLPPSRLSATLANARGIEEMVRVWLALTQVHGWGVGFAVSRG